MRDKEWDGTEAEHLEEWGDYLDDDDGCGNGCDYLLARAEKAKPKKQRVQYSDGSVKTETVVKEFGGRVITSERIDELKRLYDVAKAAKVGTTIICPVCKTEHVKTTYHKVFCSNGKKGSKDCKSRYWNTIHPERLDRLY